MFYDFLFLIWNSYIKTICLIFYASITYLNRGTPSSHFQNLCQRVQQQRLALTREVDSEPGAIDHHYSNKQQMSNKHPACLHRVTNSQTDLLRGLRDSCYCDYIAACKTQRVPSTEKKTERMNKLNMHLLSRCLSTVLDVQAKQLGGETRKFCSDKFLRIRVGLHFSKETKRVRMINSDFLAEGEREREKAGMCAA